MKNGYKQNVKKTLKKMSKCWRLYIFMLPAVIYIALFAYKPMYGILIAFKDYSLRKGIAKQIDLDYYNSVTKPKALSYKNLF